ncbi:MAG: DUF5343 domain-containing protein [Nitrosarchaeum sp.]|nr:DUF5343 domain-containing protein [Nitrosarchaeum sp.]
MSDVSFPYVASYKKIPEFFTTIQTAAVPDKVTTRVLANTFEFKGTNDRPLIGVLRSLGFIDENGVPTQIYSDYKNPNESRKILGHSIKKCYETLFQKNEKFNELSDEQIKGHFASTTGKDSNNSTLDMMVKTFLQLKNIADFGEIVHPVEKLPISTNESLPSSDDKKKDFVLSHTIVVNLPTTTDQKVYDVLFKSLKENLL